MHGDAHRSSQVFGPWASTPCRRKHVCEQGGEQAQPVRAQAQEPAAQARFGRGNHSPPGAYLPSHTSEGETPFAHVAAVEALNGSAPPEPDCAVARGASAHSAGSCTHGTRGGLGSARNCRGGRLSPWAPYLSARTGAPVDCTRIMLSHGSHKTKAAQGVSTVSGGSRCAPARGTQSGGHDGRAHLPLRLMLRFTVLVVRSRPIACSPDVFGTDIVPGTQRRGQRLRRAGFRSRGYCRLSVALRTPTNLVTNSATQ